MTTNQDAAPERRQCEQPVPSGRDGYACNQRATVFERGKNLCTQHSAAGQRRQDERYFARHPKVQAGRPESMPADQPEGGGAVEENPADVGETESAAYRLGWNEAMSKVQRDLHMPPASQVPKAARLTLEQALEATKGSPGQDTDWELMAVARTAEDHAVAYIRETEVAQANVFYESSAEEARVALHEVAQVTAENERLKDIIDKAGLDGSS